MKCSEIQSDLSLYSDGRQPTREDIMVKAHLDICPLCTQKYADFYEIKTGMRQMSRPGISFKLQDQLKRSLRDEIQNSKTAWLPISLDARQWLQTRVMPYGLGVLASLVMGFTFLSLMSAGIRDAQTLSASTLSPQRADTTIMLAANLNPFRDNYPELSAADYARTRFDISSESPSVNPKGALIALTKSLVRGGMKDDEVVVVADVFGNGLAQIAEVVEPSRDRQAVSELQKALDADPSNAPFVAANLDNRSDSVRVVLKFQSVNVSTGLRKLNR